MACSISSNPDTGHSFCGSGAGLDRGPAAASPACNSIATSSTNLIHMNARSWMLAIPILPRGPGGGRCALAERQWQELTKPQAGRTRPATSTRDRPRPTTRKVRFDHKFGWLARTLGLSMNMFELKKLLLGTLAQPVVLELRNPSETVNAIHLRDVHDLYKYGFLPAVAEERLNAAGLLTFPPVHSL